MDAAALLAGCAKQRPGQRTANRQRRQIVFAGHLADAILPVLERSPGFVRTDGRVVEDDKLGVLRPDDLARQHEAKATADLMPPGPIDDRRTCRRLGAREIRDEVALSVRADRQSLVRQRAADDRGVALHVRVRHVPAVDAAVAVDEANPFAPVLAAGVATFRGHLERRRNPYGSFRIVAALRQPAGRHLVGPPGHVRRPGLATNDATVGRVPQRVEVCPVLDRVRGVPTLLRRTPFALGRHRRERHRVDYRDLASKAAEARDLIRIFQPGLVGVGPNPNLAPRERSPVRLCRGTGSARRRGGDDVASKN